MKTKFKWITLLITLAISVLGLPVMAAAAEAPAIDTGDTAFIIVCTALVMIMTPGLALFYGGMVRKKNVLGTIMQSFAAMALVSVQWVLIGYTLGFGTDISHLIGSLQWLGMSGVGIVPNPDYSATIPQSVFAMYQLMFAIITVALISGSFAERMRFPIFIAFVLLWTTLVYDPLAHWVWGVNGWLRNLGALDFAGGTVVHISSGVSGLIACLVLGRRREEGSEAMVPHNLPMTMLGAALLWFGWFGFNAGSALGANGLAGHAFLVTNTCAAVGALSWAGAEWLHHGKPTVLGFASGLIAGLVAITPAAGFVSPASSILMGIIVGPLCYFAVSKMKSKLGYDDTLDVFGIHGVGGIFGALATGVLATTAVNPAGVDGLLFGNPHQLLVQLIAVVAAVAFAAAVTFVILKVLSMFAPLRISEDAEEIGLDITQHGEDAYSYGEMSSAHI
ncbi:MAG TPA: ammonium transporter [Syntrophomonadaceae bacterium]|nr:ammonium transporter [Syntrophomonadaceae bacterium]HPR92621.1 ammonium transporter [Syntrophomonadaceae bacterium]